MIQVTNPLAGNSLPGPDNITRTVLPNGIVLLVRSNFNSPSFVMNGYLQTGSIFDPEDKLGLASLTAGLMMRGTTKRSFSQIFESLESTGSALSFGANVHTTSFSGRGLIEDLPMLADLLMEVLSQPAFTPEHVEKVRAQYLTGLAIRAQDTADMASLAFDQILFAGHPYRFPEDGYPETISRITRDDLAEFHRVQYGPRGMVLTLVGAIDPRQAEDLVLSKLGNWQNPLQPEQPTMTELTPLTVTTRKNVSIPGKSQADIVLGCTAPLRKSPDFMPASLGNNILGVFGMMGRIGDIVREQSGLAYYAYTSLNSGTGPGSWEVSAGVNPVNVEKAIELIKGEMRRFIKEPVTAEELENSQANYIGRLPLSLESNAGVASTLLSMERYQLGLDYFLRYESLVREVTPEQILDTAKRYLDPERAAIAVAGP